MYEFMFYFNVILCFVFVFCLIFHFFSLKRAKTQRVDSLCFHIKYLVKWYRDNN